jgi:hypothetical protein
VTVPGRASSETPSSTITSTVTGDARDRQPPAADQDVLAGGVLRARHAVPAVPQQVDALGALRARGEDQVGGGGVGEAAREVVLDEPGGVVAEPVRQRHLVDDVVERPSLDLPGASPHLKLVTHADP